MISSAFIVFQIQKIPNLEGLENTQENEELFSEKKKKIIIPSSRETTGIQPDWQLIMEVIGI